MRVERHLHPHRIAAHRAQDRAFALVELIVVVIIIAVLAAIAGVATNRYVAHTRETAAAATLKELWKGAQAKAASDDQDSVTLTTLQQVADGMSGGGLALGTEGGDHATLAGSSRVVVLDSSGAATDPKDGTRVVWAYVDTTGALSGSAGALGLGTSGGGDSCAFLYASSLNMTKAIIGKADATLGCRGQVAIARATGSEPPAPVGGGESPTPTPTTDPTPTPTPTADPTADPTPTGPQAITGPVTDTFNGTGPLGAAETGNRTWIETTAGTFVRSSGKTTTSATPGTNPMALIEAGTPDVDVTLAASRGGEAIYVRASDANNWVRARLRAYDKQVTYDYYVTQYYHTTYTTEYQYAHTTYSGTGWTGSSSSFCSPSAGNNGTTYGGYTNGIATWKQTISTSGSSSATCGSTYKSNPFYVTVGNYSQSVTSSTSYYWGTSGSSGDSVVGSRQVASGGYWDTSYCSSCATTQSGPYTGTTSEKRFELIVEKSAGSTVTSLKTIDLGTTAPSTIRLLVKGDQLKVYSGTTLQATLTEAFNSTVTRHGFGLGGPTGYLTTGLDDVSIAPAP